MEEEQQRSLFKEPALWLLGLSTLCCFFNCYGMYAYLAQYLYTLDYSAGDVALVVLLNGLIAIDVYKRQGEFSIMYEGRLPD